MKSMHKLGLLCLILSESLILSKLFKPSFSLHKRAAATLSLSIGIFSQAAMLPASVVHADDTWTEKNSLAAETWKAVDEAFFDRTFNGQDWFKLRQGVVKRDYRSNEEVYTALKDMLNKLGDKYTRFLTPSQYASILNSAKGELTGVGVELLPAEGDLGTQIVQVFTDSPAENSGLAVGDIVVNVDGIDAKGLSAEDVASIMRGMRGTKASIRVMRKGEQVDVTVVREPFKLKAVTSSRLTANGKSVAFISIRSFDFSTCDNVVSALTDIKRKGPIDAIVLDLRNNGGGLLQGAVQTSNVFLSPGKTVVFVTGKDGDPKAQTTLPNGLAVQDSTLVPDLRTPLYLLVNSNTASAAEVIAAGLKVYGEYICDKSTIFQS